MYHKAIITFAVLVAFALPLRADTLTYEDRRYALEFFGLLHKVHDPVLVLSSEQPLELLVEYAVNDANGSGKYAVAYTNIVNTLTTKEVIIGRSLPTMPYMTITVKSTRGLIALLSRLDVLSVSRNADVAPNISESFPLAEIAPNAWSSLGLTGYGVSVGIIDTGIKLYRDKAPPGTGPSTLPTEVGNAVVAAVPCSGTYYPVKYSSQYNIGSDAHGTAVASVINRVAPGAKLIDLTLRSNARGEYTTADILTCLGWVENNHATYNLKVVNLSLGTSTTYANVDECRAHPLSRIAARIVGKGVNLVIASGNTGSDAGMVAPACTGNAISVAAMTDEAQSYPCTTDSCRERYTWPANVVWPGSSTSPFTTLAAPGCYVETPDSAAMNGSAQYQCGTSLAAPVVAGALAVIQGAKGLSVGAVGARNLLIYGSTSTVSKTYGAKTPIKRLNVQSSLEIGGMWLPTAPVNDTVGTMPSIKTSKNKTGSSFPIAPGDIPPGCVGSYTSPYYTCAQ